MTEVERIESDIRGIDVRLAQASAQEEQALSRKAHLFGLKAVLQDDLRRARISAQAEARNHRVDSPVAKYFGGKVTIGHQHTPMIPRKVNVAKDPAYSVPSWEHPVEELTENARFTEEDPGYFAAALDRRRDPKDYEAFAKRVALNGGMPC